jgi:hypothetical protein
LIAERGHAESTRQIAPLPVESEIAAGTATSRRKSAARAPITGAESFAFFTNSECTRIEAGDLRNEVSRFATFIASP